LVDTAVAETLKPFARQVLEVNSPAYVLLEVVEKYRFTRVIQIHTYDHHTGSTVLQPAATLISTTKHAVLKVVTRVSHAKDEHPFISPEPLHELKRWQMRLSAVYLRK
jgi:hypothetical protein